MTEKELLIDLYKYAKECYFDNTSNKARRNSIKDKIENFLKSEKPVFNVNKR